MRTSDPRSADGLIKSKQNAIYGKRGEAANQNTNYADPDGTEEVEAWECVEGCPVAELDRQSGPCKTGAKGSRGAGINGNTFKAPVYESTERGYDDTASGASRFFQTFSPDTGAGFKYVATEEDKCPHPSQSTTQRESQSNQERVSNAEGSFSLGLTQTSSQAHNGTAQESVLGSQSVELEPNTGAGFKYCPKSSRAERNKGLEGMPEKVRNITEGHGMGEINTSKKSNGGVRENKPTANVHPTVKPIALMRYLVKMVTPPGGTVLDPFAGSGSTGCAAALEGFDFIGIEQDPEYAEIARRRIAHWSLPEEERAKQNGKPKAETPKDASTLF